MCLLIIFYLILATALPLTTAFAFPPNIKSDQAQKLHFKGIFSDNGHEFELYSPDAATTGEQAFAAYMKSITITDITDDITLTYEESQSLVADGSNHLPYHLEQWTKGNHNSTNSSLSKRGYKSPYGYDPQRFPHYKWINCTKLTDDASIAGCNKDRKTAPNQYYNARGFLQTKKDLVEMWDQAFEGGNGKKTPRSVCRQAGDQNQYTLCASWSWPTKTTAPTKFQRLEMIEYAMECQGTRGMLSSQYWTQMWSPGTKKTKFKPFAVWRMLCISSRANGCTEAQWFCKDLFYAPEDFDRAKDSCVPEKCHTVRPGVPAARGPCIKNCDELRGQDPIPANATVVVPPIPYSNVQKYGWPIDQH